MQPSSTSAYPGSIKSNQWNFSNLPDNQTRCDNVFGSASASPNPCGGGFPVFSERMEVTNPMDLDANQRMATSPSNGGRKISLKRSWGVFLPLAIDIIKCQTSSPEAGGLQSDDGNNNEYLPSFPIDVTSQRNPLPSSSTSGTSTSTSTSPRARKRPRTERRTHGSAPSRNKQASTDQVEDIRVKLSLCRVNNRVRVKDLVCPVIGCEYEQFNGRMPDFRRHVKTHMRQDGEIRCKGIPWEKFERYRHHFPNIPSSQPPYAVPDEDGLWIGGCLKTFSRADALKRHLRNTSCAGLNHSRHRTFPNL